MPRRHEHEDVSSLKLAAAIVYVAARCLQVKVAIALLGGIASLDEAVLRGWRRVVWAVSDWSFARLHRRRHYCAFSATRALVSTARVIVALVVVPLFDCLAHLACWACGFAVPLAKLRASICERLGFGSGCSLSFRWTELILRLKWRWPGMPYPLFTEPEEVPGVLRAQFSGEVRRQSAWRHAAIHEEAA
jgi:hypothetical protein